MAEKHRIDDGDRVIARAGLALVHAGAMAHGANRPILGIGLGLAAVPFGVALGMRKGAAVGVFSVTFALASNAIAWRRAVEHRKRGASSVDVEARPVHPSHSGAEFLVWSR